MRKLKISRICSATWSGGDGGGDCGSDGGGNGGGDGGGDGADAIERPAKVG